MSAEGTVGRAPEIEQLIKDLVEERIFAAGAQLYVEASGTVLVDAAWGRCGPVAVDRDSVHPAYCATKPVLALVVGHMVESGLVDLDEPAGTGQAWLPPAVTVAHVLAHRAGLQQPDAATWRMTPPADRPALLSRIPVGAAGRAAYSEMAGWWALARLCESATGEPVATLVDRLIGAPFGPGLHLDAVAARDAGKAGRVRVPVAGLPADPTPLLSEQLASQLNDAAPEFGGLVSMAALGRLYGALLRVLRGEHVPGMPAPATVAAMLDRRWEASWDPVLRRECAFAGGFMVDLGDHRIGTRLSGAAVGHAAGVANCVALCDPERDLAVAVYLNGVSATAEDVEYARTALIDGIVDRIGRA